MRIGLALLVASAGCNQVFGIKDTVKQPDAAPPEFTGLMRWAAAKTVNGAPMGVDLFPIGNEAVDSAPLMLKVGPPLGMGDLVDAPYDVATGTFKFGFMLAGQPWRLVYTLPSATVAHELQWSVQQPDLVLPRMTRMGAMPVPAGGGYDIQPSPTANFSLPLVSTSGAFTSSYATTFSGNDVMYPLSDATPVNGPLAAPDSTDWMLVTDMTPVSNTLHQVLGWGTVSGVTLSTALTPVMPAWHTGPLLTIDVTETLSAAKLRISNALAALAADDSGTQYVMYPQMTYGLSPNLEVYGFVEPEIDCGTPSTDLSMSGVDCLSHPAMIPLAQDSKFDLHFAIPQLDATAIPAPPVMYARVTQTRTIHGLALTSAIQSMVIAPNPPVDMETIAVLPSTIPTAALVDTIALDGTPLSALTAPTTPDVEISAGTQARKLTFIPRLAQDGAPMATADDYIVTLYQIQNPDTGFAKLHTVRIYRITDYSVGVLIDGALLTPGLYVIAVTTRVGFPHGADGDFKTVAYPIGESTTFARQFIVH
jgi:hypothetical protein